MDFPSQISVEGNRPIRLLQLTDCHLGSEPGETLLGLDTDQSLVDVLEYVRQHEQAPDLLVATGDISGDGSVPAYHRFLDTLSDYIKAPMAWLPGNHDLPQVMAQVVRERCAKPQTRVVEVGNWQLILLDSSVPYHEHGDLSLSELQFLQQTLEARPDHHTLVFLHHQPVRVGSEWIDQYIVRNADALFGLLESYPQVKGLCWGHVHQAFEARRNDLMLWATPSTCIQFAPQLDDFTVDVTMPGYRWFDLHRDGRIETGVIRIPDKDYAINYASSGY